MPSKSKRKGNTYESELVHILQENGFKATRAWGSNGKALGEAEGVDIVLIDSNNQKWLVQAKRRAKLADYMKPPDGCEIVMMREDRGENLVVLPLQLFIKLLKGE